MLTLRDSVFSELQRFADERGVSIQGLIRAVIVPEWHLEHPGVDTVDMERDRVSKQSAPIEA